MTQYIGMVNQDRAVELWRITMEAAHERGVLFSKAIHPFWVSEAADRKFQWLSFRGYITDFIVIGIPEDIDEGIFRKLIGFYFDRKNGLEVELDPEVKLYLDSTRRMLVPFKDEPVEIKKVVE